MQNARNEVDFLYTVDYDELESVETVVFRSKPGDVFGINYLADEFLDEIKTDRDDAWDEFLEVNSWLLNLSDDGLQEGDREVSFVSYRTADDVERGDSAKIIKEYYYKGEHFVTTFKWEYGAEPFVY